MHQDDQAAIYLGRPCYYALKDEACSPRWWTHWRYAPEIVASLNSALDHLVVERVQLVLIGHSGGGTLAMLMAASRHDVSAVITLAGNLDIRRWAELHDYSPLEGSLNPVDFPLPDSVSQLHFVGRLDEVTPPLLLEEALPSLTQGVTLPYFYVIDEIDHSCCWEAHWPDIVREVEARQPGTLSR
ncbi:hypothetical protein GCM10022278_24180 [Allohahella marinimesophila]|uniref:Alpha/beta hydrolase family protein n=2 Tax=Allohahella marinimesophila TaxID=1054972 RepID=A0ABP7PH82_9GAMM